VGSSHGIGGVLGIAVVGVAGAFAGLRIHCIHLRRLVAILAFRRFFAGRRVCLTVGRFALIFARATFLTCVGRLAFLVFVVRRFAIFVVSCKFATHVK
jgi:hypothetical protein